MRKISSVQAIAALGFGILFTASTASAGNLYVKADLGYNMLEDSDVSMSAGRYNLPPATFEYDAGLFTSAAVGYDFGQFRVDGEVGYSTNDVDKVKFLGLTSNANDITVSQACLMVNGYFDVKTASAFTPYVGAGMGMSNVVYDVDSDDWDDTVLAYQLSLGLAIEINQMVDIDVAYRYFTMSDPSFTDAGETLELEYASHIVMGGVKLNF